jgi:uncharacterized protein (TIGR02611 family)
MSEGQHALVATSALGVARKVIIAVLGTTVLAVGVALIVLPGPAIVVIPLGLAILATEFLWARRLLNRVKQGTTRLFGRWRASSITLSARRTSAPPPRCGPGARCTARGAGRWRRG